MIVLVAALVVAGGWYYLSEHRLHTPTVTEKASSNDSWVEQLYSSNPLETQAAVQRVGQLGPDALPVIHKILQDPNATPAQVKGAIKACALLGPLAAPAIGEVAEQLPDPTVTADAAMALSFMGPEAFAPLKHSLSSKDAAIRREALRSIGKLKDRAPLDPVEVVPLLIDAMSDADASVRAVAATYLGIIHEGGADAVTALMGGLNDQTPDVRRASATALGSFGSEAEPAIAALRKAAASDPDQDVAREAGVSLVKLTSK